MKNPSIYAHKPLRIKAMVVKHDNLDAVAEMLGARRYTTQRYVGEENLSTVEFSVQVSETLRDRVIRITFGKVVVVPEESKDFWWNVYDSLEDLKEIYSKA